MYERRINFKKYRIKRFRRIKYILDEYFAHKEDFCFGSEMDKKGRAAKTVFRYS